MMIARSSRALARLASRTHVPSTLSSPSFPAVPRIASRSLASATLDIEDDLSAWPLQKANTVLNVCPQACCMVVERLGKFHSIHHGGIFFAIPIIDDIRFVVDLREKSLSISPQAAITKDNVHVTVSGNLYCQFTNPEKAAYGSKNPIYAVKQHAQSAMRAAIGELELDEILHARARLNSMIQTAVQGAADAWGIEIKRYEITDITPDKFITEAMDKQAAAERERRKRVLDAEGEKRAAELQSEGEKIRMKNESEGNLIRVRNEAEAKKTELILEAEGRARAEEITAAARANAILTLANALASANGTEAAKLQISREYISMYGEIGSKSNTMIFSDRPGDVNSLIAQASAILRATPSSENKIEGK